MEVIKSDSLSKTEKMQSAVTTRIITKLEEIEEIFSISAESCIIKTEINEGVANVSGRLNFKLLVKDKTEGIVSLNYNAEFSEKCESESFKADSSVLADVTVTAASVELLSGNEIEVTAELDFYLTAKSTVEASVASIPEGIKILEKSCPVAEINTQREESFSVAYETTMPIGTVKVLQAEGCAYLESVSVSENLRLEGKVELQIVYLNSENLPAVMLIPVDFEEEFELKDIKDTDKIWVRLKCNNTKVHLDMDESEALSLNAEMTIKAFITVFSEIEKETLIDAYSLTRELETTEESYTTSLWKGSQTVKIGFSGGTVCNNAVSRVLGAVNARCQVITCQSGEGSAQVDAIVRGRVLYLNADDKLESSPFELPISVLCSLPFADKECKAVCEACVTDISVKRNGGNADITGSVAVNITVYKTIVERIITDITEGEEKGKGDSAIEVVMAEAGDTLWNIGKSLSMSVEELIALNPELTEPITSPVRIVIYRQM